MVDVLSRAAMSSNSAGFVWRRIARYITTLFDEPRPSSLDSVITLMSPRVHWIHKSDGEDAVVRWAAASMAVPHTEVVGRSMIDALLQIASTNYVPRIPIELWVRMRDQQSLPPFCLGRFRGSYPAVVRFVRGLGDVEILKSYFLLIWSEWDWLRPSGLNEIEVSIREDLCGTGMRHHRRHLIERLDHVLRQLDRGFEYLRQHNPKIHEHHLRLAKNDYRWLKRVLLEVDREDRNASACALSDLTHLY